MPKKKKVKRNEKSSYKKFEKWLSEELGFDYTGRDIGIRNKGFRVDIAGVKIDENGNFDSVAIEVKKDKIRMSDLGQAFAQKSWFRKSYLAIGKRYEYNDEIKSEARKNGIGLLDYIRGEGVRVVVEAEQREENDEIRMNARELVEKISGDEVIECDKCGRLMDTEDIVCKIIFISRDEHDEEDEFLFCDSCAQEIEEWLEND